MEQCFWIIIICSHVHKCQLKIKKNVHFFNPTIPKFKEKICDPKQNINLLYVMNNWNSCLRLKVVENKNTWNVTQLKHSFFLDLLKNLVVHLYMYQPLINSFQYLICIKKITQQINLHNPIFSVIKILKLISIIGKI